MAARPGRDAPWQALLPDALLVAIGFQVLQRRCTATLVVMAPVLNSSLHEELRSKQDEAG